MHKEEFLAPEERPVCRKKIAERNTVRGKISKIVESPIRTEGSE
jgi:hypothetical protein